MKTYLLCTLRYACLLDAGFRVVGDIYDAPTECGDFVSQSEMTIETAVKMHDILRDSYSLRPQPLTLTPHSGLDSQSATYKQYSISSTFATSSGRYIELICPQSLPSLNPTNSAVLSIAKDKTLLLTDVGLLFTTSPIQIHEFEGSEYHFSPCCHVKDMARAQETNLELLQEVECNISEDKADGTSIDQNDVDTD